MFFLRLFNRYVLRALLREKARTLVAATGVALGVAVMVAIRLANVSVTEAFNAAVDSVSGNASLQIRGTAGRFDEQLFADLDSIRSYGHLSPIIEAYAMVGDENPRQDQTEGFPRGELLHVLGVDVLLDFPLRDYQVLSFGDAETQSARNALRLLDDKHSVILTEKFLRRCQLRVGEAVGASRKTVLALFLGEALLLAAIGLLIGLLIGLPVGRLLGSAAVSATAQTVETFYIAAVAESSASALQLGLLDVFVMACIVVPLALLAALATRSGCAVGSGASHARPLNMSLVFSPAGSRRHVRTPRASGIPHISERIVCDMVFDVTDCSIPIG